MMAVTSSSMLQAPASFRICLLVRSHWEQCSVCLHKLKKINCNLWSIWVSVCNISVACTFFMNVKDSGQDLNVLISYCTYKENYTLLTSVLIIEGKVAVITNVGEMCGGGGGGGGEWNLQHAKSWNKDVIWTRLKHCSISALLHFACDQETLKAKTMKMLIGLTVLCCCFSFHLPRGVSSSLGMKWLITWCEVWLIT